MLGVRAHMAAVDGWQRNDQTPSKVTHKARLQSGQEIPLPQYAEEGHDSTPKNAVAYQQNNTEHSSTK